MLLFIIIFFAMVIIGSAAAVAGISLYLKRRDRREPAAPKNQRQFNEPTGNLHIHLPEELMKTQTEIILAEQRQSMFDAQSEKSGNAKSNLPFPDFLTIIMRDSFKKSAAFTHTKPRDRRDTERRFWKKFRSIFPKTLYH